MKQIHSKLSFSSQLNLILNHLKDVWIKVKQNWKRNGTTLILIFKLFVSLYEIIECIRLLIEKR